MNRETAQETREGLFEEYVRLLLQRTGERTCEGRARELFDSLKEYRLLPPGVAGNEADVTRGGLFTKLIIRCSEHHLLTEHGGPAMPLVRYNRAGAE